MNTKVFLACFVGLLAVNVSNQSPTLKEDSVNVLLVEVLDTVLNVTTNLLNEVNGIIDYIDQDQGEINDIIVLLATTVGKQINTLILQGVDGLRDGATDDGKAVIDCIDAEKSKTEAALATVFGDIGTCAAGEIPIILTQVKAIQKQLGDLNADVQGQTDTLRSCSDDDQTCLQAFVTTFVATAKKIPPAVTEDITAIIQLIQTIIGDVSGCAGDVVQTIKAAAQDIFNEAVVCIKK